MPVVIMDASIYKHVPGGELVNANIIIKDNKIHRITDNQNEVKSFIEENPETEVLSSKEKIVLPGFVNAHTHSPMSVFRNYASDRSLHDWLFNMIIPKEQLLTEEDAYWTSLASQAEMIRSGTCAFADMYFHFESLVRAVRHSGMRANLTVMPLSNKWNEGKRKTVSNAQEAISLFKKYNDNEMITLYTELHSVYLYDIDMIHVNVEVAKELNTGIHIHLHETEKEVDDCLREHNKRPIELLREIGVFTRPVLAAHCVVMNDDDIDILKEDKINVCENISSNLKLVSGIPRIPEMIDKGVNVVLGTDGCASNNNLNMFEEMHISAIVHKNQMKDPTVMPAHKLIEMATKNGYEAIGFKDRAGDVAEGMLADLIMVDISSLHCTPINEVAACIVYSMQASDVDTVIINGRIVMRNKEFVTIDEELVKHKVRTVAKRLGL